ncbi:hypothetical protein [Pedobacter frigidisoli]|uniref:hypothetical protein n=1 Tax=Pedobacter frigidisoli TaxID=2530455 RepID=UPI0013F164EE|nr:hypothetical protein [Pedobacter frigidisoli]
MKTNLIKIAAVGITIFVGVIIYYKLQSNEWRDGTLKSETLKHFGSREITKINT